MRPNAQRIPAQDRFVKEQEDEDEADGADERWPTRLPSSARRYQGLGDVRHEVGRSADVQTQVSRRGLVRTTGERHLIPARRTAQQQRPPALPAVPSPPRDYLDEDEDEDQIVHTQTRGQGRGTGIVQKRVPARAGQAVRGQSQNLGQVRYRVRPHWLFFVGLAMLTMLLGWVALSALGSWWQTTLDDWHYGRPRTYQADAVVGHHDSTQNPSHFIAMNLNGHIMVIEIPGGDPSKSVVYSGPALLGPGQDLTPVTLSFRDVNHDGTLDMIVNVQNNQFVFLNQHGTFVPANQKGNSTG